MAIRFSLVVSVMLGAAMGASGTAEQTCKVLLDCIVFAATRF